MFCVPSFSDGSGNVQLVLLLELLRVVNFIAGLVSVLLTLDWVGKIFFKNQIINSFWDKTVARFCVQFLLRLKIQQYLERKQAAMQET